MQGILVPLLAGLLGTAAMSFLLLSPAWLGLPRVDLVRAMGSYITGNRETAFTPGIVLHFLVGILFGYVYYWGYRFALVPLTPLSGLAGGAVHGTLIMLFVSIAVLEHHPDKRYQRRGPMTGFAQLLGHIVYGCGGWYGVLALGSIQWRDALKDRDKIPCGRVSALEFWAIGPL